MKRKAFLALTGLSSDDLSNMRRRGSSPLFAELDIESGVTTEAEGRKIYRDAEAVHVAIAGGLMRLGIHQPTIGSFVRRNARWLRLFEPFRAVGRDIHFGAIVDAAHPAKPIGGPVDNLHVFDVFGVGQEDQISLRPIGEFERDMESIVLVNVSAILRRIDLRAREAGIEFDPDGAFQSI